MLKTILNLIFLIFYLFDSFKISVMPCKAIFVS